MIFLESRHRANPDRSKQVKKAKGPVRWWHVLILTFIIVGILVILVQQDIIRVFNTNLA